LNSGEKLDCPYCGWEMKFSEELKIFFCINCGFRVSEEELRKW